jgi:hypothetical protein
MTFDSCLFCGRCLRRCAPGSLNQGCQPALILHPLTLSQVSPKPGRALAGSLTNVLEMFSMAPPMLPEDFRVIRVNSEDEVLA